MNEIYIINCDHSFFNKRRQDFYIVGMANALDEFESCKKEGVKPILYETEVAPTGLIMRSKEIKRYGGQ